MRIIYFPAHDIQTPFAFSNHFQELLRGQTGRAVGFAKPENLIERVSELGQIELILAHQSSAIGRRAPQTLHAINQIVCPSVSAHISLGLRAMVRHIVIQCYKAISRFAI